ncbi:response regulator [Nitrospira japonica]|nr:response regulator [Nitrospira japonica]
MSERSHHQTGSQAPFDGDGEMDRRVRAFDWSKTPIGAVESWSPTLRTMVNFLLANRFPLLLWWGPDYVSLYNDAYRPILGAKHPNSLGQPVRDCWSEIWHILQPLIDTPFHGGPPTWNDDLMLEINRRGFIEETHFTIAYSPVPDDTVPNGIGGVLATVHEITDKVVGERRLNVLKDVGMGALDAKTPEEACAIAAHVLSGHPQDIPFALLYLVDTPRDCARLVGVAGAAPDGPVAPSSISLKRHDDTVPWPLAEVMATETLLLLPGSTSRFPTVPGPGTEPSAGAVVVPIRSNVAHELAGFFVAGLSPRLQFDDGYRSFLELISTQIATGIASARAYEEERRRAEALAELDRTKTAFFSNVSHEFRTPLTLMIEPLRDSLDDQTTPLAPIHRDRLGLAYRNSRRLLKLVNTLLDFARIEAGRALARYEPTDLAALTVQLAAVFRSAVERAQLRLTVDCPTLSEPIYIDREMWEKIVLNLLSNAFKFTLQGSITVVLRQDGSGAVLDVRDTGVGIPDEELSKIFERFHRVQGAGGRTIEGSGIGLALVKQLVQLHGGSLTVTSILNEGSVFTVRIPFGTAHLPADQVGPVGSLESGGAKADLYWKEALRWLPDEQGDGQPTSEPEADPEPSFRFLHGASDQPRPRVLLADDNADMRTYLTRLLDPYFDVDAVTDGSAALAAARARPPDVILSDVMMPSLDGFGLVRALRAEPSTRAIPIILLSARAGEGSRIEGLARGADDYLIKPFSARELLARVESHYELARLRRDMQGELARSKLFLERMAAATPDILFVHDIQEGRNIYSNKRVDTILGYNSAEIRGMSGDVIDQIVHPDDLRTTREWFARFDGVEEGEALEHEHRIRHVDGSYRWLLSRATAFERGPDGRVKQIIGVATDITERKQAQEELLARSRQQRLLFELAEAVNHADALPQLYEQALDSIIQTLDADRASILLLENDGVIRFKAWRGLSEAYRRAVEGHSPWKADETDPRPITIGDIAAADLEPGLKATIVAEGIRALSFIPLMYGGRLLGKFMVYFDRPRIMDPNQLALAQAIGGTLATGIDRRTAETRLRESEDRLRSFATQLEQMVADRTDKLMQSQKRLRAMATELNFAEQRERKRMAMELHDHLAQMLVLCRLNLGQLRRSTKLDDKGAELVQQTQDVLSESLTYTRTLVADLAPPVLHEFGLVAALRWLADRMVRHSLQVDVRADGVGEVVLAEDQAVLLFQSVRELLINAAKHGQSGRALLSIERQPGSLCIEVGDDGKGFDPSTAFAVEVPTALSSKFGLYSIRERMTALGGRLDLVSQPGNGTKARLVLPLREKAEALSPASDGSVDSLPHVAPPLLMTQPEDLLRESRLARLMPRQKTMIRVLLVDDHAMVRQGLRSVLETYADVEVVGEARDGFEALACVDRLQPSVVVMDVNMPGMNGIDATRRIRASHPHTIVIGLSVNAGTENDQAMKQAGAAVLLTKEAAVDELYSAIQVHQTTGAAGHMRRI